MLSRLAKSAELTKLAGAMFLRRSFAATRLKKAETRVDEPEEEAPQPKLPRTIEKLGIVDDHVSALRENLNTQWMRELDFETKIRPVLNKYKELGLSQDDLNNLAKKWPEGLVLNNNPEKKMDIFELIEHLGSKYGVKNPAQLRNIISTAPEYMMNSKSSLDERIDRLQNFLQLDNVNFE